jgi:hypothetical protein
VTGVEILVLLGLLAFSPAGNMYAYVNAEHGVTIRTWPEKALVQRFAADGDEIRALQFSPDGAMLAMAGTGGAVTLRALPDGTLLKQSDKALGPVSNMQFSRDGSWLAVAGNTGVVHFLSVPDLQPLKQFNMQTQKVLSFTVSGDEQWLAAATAGNGLQIWSIPEARLTQSIADNELLFAMFLPGGADIAAADESGGMFFYAHQGGTWKQSAALTSPSEKSIQLGGTCPDGSCVYFSDLEYVFVLDNDRNLKLVYEAPEIGVRGIAASAASQAVAIMDWDGNLSFHDAGFFNPGEPARMAVGSRLCDALLNANPQGVLDLVHPAVLEILNQDTYAGSEPGHALDAYMAEMREMFERNPVVSCAVTSTVMIPCEFVDQNDFADMGISPSQCALLMLEGEQRGQGQSEERIRLMQVEDKWYIPEP